MISEQRILYTDTDSFLYCIHRIIYRKDHRAKNPNRTPQKNHSHSHNTYESLSRIPRSYRDIIFRKNLQRLCEFFLKEQ